MGTDAVNILRPNGLFTILLKGVLAGLKERLMTVTSHELSVQVAINSWRLVLERVNKTLSSLADDQLLKEVAPGKPYTTHATSLDAWHAARSAAGVSDLVCITGSVFLAGELRPVADPVFHRAGQLVG